MNGRSMYRYVVPADDHPHAAGLSHSPVAVAGTNTYVEFWAEHTEDAPIIQRWFRVFGTGHPLPPAARWIGTCPRTREGLVWHLYEVGAP